MKLNLALCVAVAVIGLGGCGSSAPIAAGCSPGQTARCACPSGASALRICGANGAYGACMCGGADGAAEEHASVDDGGAGKDAASDKGASDATVAPPPPDAMAAEVAPASTGCVTSGKLIGGKEVLVDLYPIDAGFIVVRTDAVLLVGRDRSVLKTVTAPRPIMTASFDGKTLVVADAAMITIYSTALESQGIVLLTEACASSVLVDGGIFVCGPANDWDRVFYTYDVVAKKPIAHASKKYTYNGIPMRRVPGTNDFITVNLDLSPSDFHLYTVTAGGADVVYVNESPYHGDFPATNTYGFDGTPAAHIVDMNSLLLRIYGDGCDVAHNSFTSGCFIKDGNLGILPANKNYLALANDDTGRLFALTNDTTSSSLGPLCPGGCTVQRIDVASRTVAAQGKHLMAVSRVVAMRPDPKCKMVALGYQVATSTSYQSDYAGYQIDLFDYGEQ